MEESSENSVEKPGVEAGAPAPEEPTSKPDEPEPKEPDRRIPPHGFPLGKQKQQEGSGWA